MFLPQLNNHKVQICRMSFKATISDPEKQSIWFRTVSVLSTIHEDIKFTITSGELIAWTINSTDTTLCQVRFARQFFDEFEFKPYDIVFGEDGVQIVTDSQGSDHRLFSFQINGRHLTTVSRKPESESIKNFTVAINNTTTCPDTLTNRLLVYVEMDSLISKEYSPQIQPIKYDPIIIDLKYKRKFLDVYGATAVSSSEEPLDPKLLNIFVDAERQLSTALFNNDMKSDTRQKDQLTISDEINYICCNQALLKNFLDNCNTNVTEEVKLEINVHKLNVTAFTKAVYGKNSDILRNTMSLSNTISTTDLEHYCLFTTIDDDTNENDMKKKNTERKDQTKCIIFKLKDFKNFLSIASAWKNTQSGNISIWFCHRGDPILMEMNKPGVRLELVQVTDSNGASVNEERHSPSFEKKVIKKTISPKKTKHQDMNNNNDTGVSRISPLKNTEILKDVPISPLKNAAHLSPNGKIARQLFVSEDSTNIESQNTARPGRWTNPSEGWNKAVPPIHKPVGNSQIETEKSTQGVSPAERSGTTIGWGKRPLEEENKVSNEDKQTMLKREKLKCFQELKEGQKRAKSELHGLGPTQLGKPKGLFD